jgi:hypothetical protein
VDRRDVCGFPLETSSTQRVMLDSSMSVFKGNKWLDVTSFALAVGLLFLMQI